MESSSCCGLTQLELDAVLQLIQLSSASDDDLRFFWVDLAKDRRRGKGGGAAAAAEESSISSMSSSSSSSIINHEEILLDGEDDDEPLPRINHKFGSLIDIYAKTTHAPFIKKKRARF